MVRLNRTVDKIANLPASCAGSLNRYAKPLNQYGNDLNPGVAQWIQAVAAKAFFAAEAPAGL
jgi:hypothetical protein